MAVTFDKLSLRCEEKSLSLDIFKHDHNKQSQTHNCLQITSKEAKITEIFYVTFKKRKKLILPFFPLA
jgi:hypothetical protein